MDRSGRRFAGLRRADPANDRAAVIGPADGRIGVQIHHRRHDVDPLGPGRMGALGQIGSRP
jgi:hypothetical protein